MSGNVKLTAMQGETLQLIKKGKVSNTRCGYGAWRIFGASPSVVGRLVSMKLASWGPHDPDRISCIITDAGAAILEAKQ